MNQLETKTKSEIKISLLLPLKKTGNSSIKSDDSSISLPYIQSKKENMAVKNMYISKPEDMIKIKKNENVENFNTVMININII